MGVRTALTITGWRFLGNELVDTERTPRRALVRAMDNPLIVLVARKRGPTSDLQMAPTSPHSFLTRKVVKNPKQ